MSTSLTGNWNYPTAMRFGAGRIKELPEACRSLGMQRPLLITDPALAALPMVQDTLEICRAAGLPCGLFSDVQGNPVEANVSAGVQAFKDGGHDGGVL